MKIKKYQIKLAKPTGITLPDHTSHVVVEIYNYLQTQSYFLQKMSNLFPDVKMVDELIKTGMLHDEGKKAPPWQNACQKDNKLRLQGKDFGYNIMTANYRHEFMSALMYFDNLSDDEFIAILGHHGKIRWNDKNIAHALRVEGLNDETKTPSKIRKRIRRIDKKLQQFSNTDRAKWVYRYNAQRAILQFCDRKASYFESAGKKYEDLLRFNEFNYTFPEDWEKRKIQELLNKCSIDDDLFIAKAKTGGGKRDAALLLGRRIVKAGFADRVILAMPTIFTTNAMADGITNETGTECYAYNSSTKNLKNKITDKEELNYFSFDLYQRRTFQYPLTVCTVDTLLNAITQKSEDMHAANFNIGNSFIIIDELDFYDDLVIANIKEFLKQAHAMNVKVLIMSATFPRSYRNFFLDIAPNYKVSPLIIDDTHDDKKRYNIHMVERYDVENAHTIPRVMLRKVDKSKKTIIFCNTQKSCLRMYNLFRQRYSDDEVMVYNSYHCPPDKQIKEREIMNDIGKNPTTDKYKVIIMSQIGELSLNITCDYMISEICPIDRLVQRLGRIGRFDDMSNPVIKDVGILIPTNSRGDFPAPYGDLIQRVGWIECDSLRRTKELLNVGIYCNTDLQKIIELVYVNGIVLEGDVTNNLREYENLIKTNALKLPPQVFTDDEMNETDTTQWQRRRFMAKVNLYLTPFDNPDEPVDHSDFNYATTRNTVEVYVYQLRQLSESSFTTQQDIIIKDYWGERPMTINYLSRPHIYSYERGLNLLLVN